MAWLPLIMWVISFVLGICIIVVLAQGARVTHIEYVRVKPVRWLYFAYHLLWLPAAGLPFILWRVYRVDIAAAGLSDMYSVALWIGAALSIVLWVMQLILMIVQAHRASISEIREFNGRGKQVYYE